MYMGSAIVQSLLMAMLLVTAVRADVNSNSTESQSNVDKMTHPSPPLEAYGVPLPAWSCGTDSIELAQKLLPKRFKRHVNFRHVILTDASWDSLIQIRTALRRTWSEYRSLARRLGLVLQKPDQKLACIVFNDHEDFLDFSRKTLGDHPMLMHAGGYYCHRFNWIVFYEPEHQQMIDAEHRRLDSYQHHLNESRQSVSGEQVDQETAARLEGSWRRQQDFIDESRRQIESWAQSTRTRVAIHEAIHQFTHVCGKSNDKHSWPGWLHEGLATSFEASDATLGFGPDRLSIHRDEPFIGLVNSNQLVPLRDFVSLKGYPNETPGALHIFYAQSYGLLTWLYEYRTPQLASFLKELSDGTESGQPHDVADLFEKHFGDIDRLEKRWLRVELTDWRSDRY